MWITLLGALISTLVNLILVRKIGILGAGWAILISYASMALALFIFGQKNYKINYDYKKIFIMTFFAILIIFANSFIKDIVCIKTYILKSALLILYPLIILFLLRNQKIKIPLKK